MIVRIVGLLILLVAPGTATATLFGPYVQAVTGSTAVVLWEGDRARSYELNLSGGRDGATLSSSIDSVWVDEEWRPRCEVHLRGLVPGSVVTGYLSDHDGSRVNAGELIFRTAASRGNVNFLVVGDTGTGSSAQRRVASLMGEAASEFVLHVGDVVYSKGEREDYDARFFEIYRDLIRCVPFFPVVGNHDLQTDDAAPLLDVFRFPDVSEEVPESHRGRYYSFRWGDGFFIAVDSNPTTKKRDVGCSGEGRKVGRSSRYEHVKDLDFENQAGAQYRWFEKELAGAPAECWVVVFMHHPPLSASYHGGYCGILDALADAQRNTGRKIDVVFAGHEHDYQRSWPIDLADLQPDRPVSDDPDTSPELQLLRPVRSDQGTLFFVTGGGGGRQTFRPSPDLTEPWIARGKKIYHFLQVFLSSNEFIVQARDHHGDLLDQVRILR